MSYWVAVVVRNAEQTIKRTLDSILNQTLPAKHIIMVDDGSTDSTPQILSDYARLNRGLVNVIRLPDRGYDIRRVPKNINLASQRAAEKGVETDYFMISGDDCSYSREYVELLTQRMRDKRSIVVASGCPSAGGITGREHTPSGSGRLIRCNYWKQVGNGYPLRAGWETWLLYMAEKSGAEVKLFNDLVFDHSRPRGSQHQFVYWGAAMYTLGYHPLYAIGRIAKNLIMRSVTFKGSLNLLRGYIQARLGSADSFMAPFEPSLRQYVGKSQVRRMLRVVSALARMTVVSR